MPGGILMSRHESLSDVFPLVPRRFIVRGHDQFGRPMAEIVEPMPPPLYFWLGRDAYPEWPTITQVLLR